MAASRLDQAVAAADCLVLLSYFGSSSAIENASSVFKSNLEALPEPSSSVYHEYLHQSFAKLLFYHVQNTKLFQPSFLRATLMESLDLFPQNTMFLSLFAWNERRFRVDDRVRSVIKHVISQPSVSDSVDFSHQDLITHVFAIQNEITQSLSLGYNSNTIRSTFEDALESASVQRSAMVWRTYCLFECSIAQHSRAKSVFYRAVRSCPWAKDLYMLAFSHLKPLMDAEELNGCYTMMQQRELRLLFPLEGSQ